MTRRVTKKRAARAPWYLYAPEKAHVQKVFIFICAKGHEKSHFYDLSRVPLWLRCRCGKKAIVKEMAKRIRDCLDTVGRMNDVSFAHQNEALVPTNPRMKREWIRKGLIKYRGKTPYVQVDDRTQYAKMLHELGYSNIHGEGKWDERRQDEMYPLKMEKGRTRTMPYEDPRNLDPGMAHKMANDPDFARRWNPRARKIFV